MHTVLLFLVSILKGQILIKYLAYYLGEYLQVTKEGIKYFSPVLKNIHYIECYFKYDG